MTLCLFYGIFICMKLKTTIDKLTAFYNKNKGLINSIIKAIKDIINAVKKKKPEDETN